MKAPFFIEIIRLVEGDDLPMMMDGKKRMPLFYPCVYLTTTRRRKCSPQTLEKELRNIMFLYVWSLSCGIDIEERYLYGDFLDIHECRDLVEKASYNFQDIVKQIPAPKVKRKSNDKVFQIKDFPVLPKKTKPKTVSNNTQFYRVLTIRGYLDFLAEDRLHSINTKRNKEKHRYLTDRRKDIDEYLKDNAPPSDKKSLFNLPFGISAQSEKLIMDVVNPNSKENPWDNPIVRIRNEVIVKLMFGLGMRRGEVLGLKIKDINFKTNRLFIAKRENDPDDPRLVRSRQKTLPRIHPMAPALSKLLRDYITKHRTILRMGNVNKLDTEFVFVSVQDGEPMSLRRIAHIFSDLKKVPGIPQTLNSHTGRRNWNDRFSADCDMKRGTDQEIPAEREQMYRNYYMGWTKNSEMGQTYSRRHIIESAIYHQAATNEKWFNENFSSDAYMNAIDRMRTKGEELEDLPF